MVSMVFTIEEEGGSVNWQDGSDEEKAFFIAKLPQLALARLDQSLRGVEAGTGLAPGRYRITVKDDAMFLDMWDPEFVLSSHASQYGGKRGAWQTFSRIPA